MLKYAKLAMFGLSFVAVNHNAAQADVVALHQGATDPTTEGFSFSSAFGASSVGRVTNDLGSGTNAWNISSLTPNTQVGEGFSFTSTQSQSFLSLGATVTLVARVVSGPLNATGANFYPSSVSSIEFGNGRRYDLALVLNANGDTVVVLASDLLGGTNFYTPGSSYTLTDSESTYHTYQLIYSDSSKTADLYVDGIGRLFGYAGQTHFFSATGDAYFGADNNGSVNVSLFKVETGVVPEPGSMILAGIGGILVLGVKLRSRR